MKRTKNFERDSSGRFFWSILVSAAFAVAAFTAPAKATVFPVTGGMGDRGEELHCPDNELLVGFKAQFHGSINQLSLYCAAVQSDYSIGAWDVLPPRGGGSAIVPIESYCMDNSAIRGIEFQVSSYLYTIKFSCLRPRDGSDAGTGLVGVDAGMKSISQNCSGSEYASGLVMRYGKDVNAIGLICAAVVPRSSPHATEILMRPTSKLPSNAAGNANAGNAGNAGATEETQHYRVLGKRHPQCKPNYFSRLAGPYDYVCVEIQSRAQVALENNAAASRVDPNGAYGRSSCVSGFVWREAFDGDLVCVTPERRDAVKQENAMAASRWQ